MMNKWQLNEKYIFEGREISYDSRGNGPALIMVHGTPWSSFNLRHLINALSDTFTVYYFDLLGYGQSDKSNDNVSLEIQNRLLTGLIEHWQLERPYIIGHDFGGTTVLRSHLLNNIDFKKMVVINPVALSPWGSPFFKHIEKNEAAFAGVPDYIHEAIVSAYIKTAAYQTIENEILDRTIHPWTGAEGKGAFYRQIAQANSKFTDEVQDNYSDIKTPVLILWGEEDQWIPVEQAHTLYNKIPNSKMVIVPQAGHLVIEERPEILIEEIRAFLSNEI